MVLCSECQHEFEPEGNPKISELECPECGYTAAEKESKLPQKGKLYFHNDSADSLAAQPSFDNITYEDNQKAYEALRNFMYEVEVEVEVTENAEVNILSINGQQVD